MGRKRTEDAIRAALPEDLPVIEVRMVDDRHAAPMALVKMADYRVDLEGESAPAVLEQIPAFMARETTCQQQLRFLEKIYDDHFSAPSEEAKTARIRMILDNMNDVIPSMDYSDESGSGSVEALKVLKDLYSDLLKQA